MSPLSVGSLERRPVRGEVMVPGMAKVPMERLFSPSPNRGKDSLGSLRSLGFCWLETSMADFQGGLSRQRGVLGLAGSGTAFEGRLLGDPWASWGR